MLSQYLVTESGAVLNRKMGWQFYLHMLGEGPVMGSREQRGHRETIWICQAKDQHCPQG